MKNLLICSLLSLLAGCSLFYTTPPSVVNGQRAVYQGITLMKENSDTIIDRYATDTKSAVTYHLHFVCETRIKDIDTGFYDDWDDASRDNYTEQESERFRSQRDRKIKSAHSDIDKIAEEMKRGVAINHNAMRKLVSAIYNYLSTTPIEVDNIGFLIEKLDAATKR